MSRNNLAEITIDEAISTLNKSDIPTVIIEGYDDVIVMRHLENIHRARMLSVFPVGGRSKILKIFERRSELNRTCPTIFFCDRDLWILDSIPSLYNDDNIVLTDGYSIENDLIRDGNIISLLEQDELASFESELSSFLKWYCKEIVFPNDGLSPSISTHPGKIFGSDEFTIPSDEEINSHDQLRSLYQITVNEYTRIARGKSIVALINRQLSKPSREIKHNMRSLFAYIASKPGPLISRIFHEIGVKLHS